MERKGADGRRRIRLLAVGVSILVHVILFFIFGKADFAPSTVGAGTQQAAVAKLAEVRRAAESSFVIPKPKVKRLIEKRVESSLGGAKTIGEIFSGGLGGLQGLETSGDAFDGAGASPVISGSVENAGTEFFGCWTDERRICYVVDSSGSMQGLFGQVRERLKDSIAGLQPDQYFYIIFFGDGGLFEFNEGAITRASSAAKAEANDFIDSIKPSGTTNAMEALERAAKMGEIANPSAGTIYFLTDGFELADEVSDRSLERLWNLIKRFATGTKINTIGFWPTENDEKLLEAIARRSGGEFVSVKGDLGD
jgi:hypothetical protein